MVPILPQPRTPSVLPVISTPMKRFFSHLPAWVDASACGICRASASISVIACSAVVIELPKGVFITMMPLAVAAGMSTLSTPMPARPMTFNPFACSRILAVTLVAERMASPSKLLMTAASLSLSLPRLGWKSTSTPRSLKICTAAGDSASEMRTLGFIVITWTSVVPSALPAWQRLRARPPASAGARALRRLGQRLLGQRIGPVEPRHQGLDVGGLDGRAAPDTQARRRVAVGRDVVGDAFLLQRRRHALGEGGLPVCRQPAHRRVANLEAYGRVRADRRVRRQEVDPGRARHPVGDDLRIGVGARDQVFQAAQRLRPRQRIEIILHAQHRRRVDGFALKNAGHELAALGHAENLRQRPWRLVGLEPLHGAR